MVKETITCVSCSEEYSKDEKGLKCEEGDFICQKNSCASKFIDSWLQEPIFPLKCFCEKKICQESFQNCLNSRQEKQFQNLCAKECLQENEEFVECTKCGYFEYSPKDNQEILFHCKREGCEQVTCIVCKKSHKKIEYGFQDEDQILELQQEYEQHLTTCAQYGNYVQQNEKIIEEGQQQACPSCGYRGVKNNACNKITCPRCEKGWCYYCGLLESEFDKDNPDLPYTHYDGWEENSKRCPLYLEDLHQYDSRYPEKGEDCLTLIHKNKTLRSLRKFVQNIGVQIYYELCKYFPKVGKSQGFSLEQILKEDLSLTKI